MPEPFQCQAVSRHRHPLHPPSGHDQGPTSHPASLVPSPKHSPPPHSSGRLSLVHLSPTSEAPQSCIPKDKDLCGSHHYGSLLPPWFHFPNPEPSLVSFGGSCTKRRQKIAAGRFPSVYNARLQGPPARVLFSQGPGRVGKLLPVLPLPQDNCSFPRHLPHLPHHRRLQPPFPPNQVGSPTSC